MTPQVREMLLDVARHRGQPLPARYARMAGLALQVETAAAAIRHREILAARRKARPAHDPAQEVVFAAVLLSSLPREDVRTTRDRHAEMLAEAYPNDLCGQRRAS